MAAKSIQLRLQSLLQYRAREDYGFSDPQPSALAKFISRQTGVSRKQAEALIWGEGGNLDPAALSTIAACFSLHEELLGALIYGSSEEILRHIAGQIKDDILSPEACDACAELSSRVAALSGSGRDLGAVLWDETEETDLYLDLLDHVTGGNGSFQVSPMEGDELTDSLLEIFHSLDREQQILVLGFACQQAGTGSEHYDAFNAYKELRLHLSPLARAACDQLALAPGGELSSSELAAQLNLTDKRALGQMRRSISRVIDKLEGTDRDQLDNPLTVLKAGKERIFHLQPRARQAWAAMLKAEASALLVTEDLV